jgi:hypothetical protein
MPRTIQQILANADQLAKRFEDFDPEPGSGKDAKALRELRTAFEETARAQERLAEAAVIARAEGHSWAAIGAMVGTSGEAARQRYGATSPTKELGRQAGRGSDSAKGKGRAARK